VTAAPGALAPERLRKGRVTTGTGGDTPAFPARWFDGLFRALLGEPCCIATVVVGKTFDPHENLAPSLGAPEPHDFAVREECRSSTGTLASIAFRSTFVTTRNAPHVGAEWKRLYAKSEIRKTEIFLPLTLDRFFARARTGQISCNLSHSISPSCTAVRDGNPPERNKIRKLRETRAAAQAQWTSPSLRRLALTRSLHQQEYPNNKADVTDS
jgi:hypothetical protein